MFSAQAGLFEVLAGEIESWVRGYAALIGSEYPLKSFHYLGFRLTFVNESIQVNRQR